MFIRHDDYVINTDQIKYIKINSNNSLVLFFDGKPEGASGPGYNLILRFESEMNLDFFLERLNNQNSE